MIVIERAKFANCNRITCSLYAYSCFAYRFNCAYFCLCYASVVRCNVNTLRYALAAAPTRTYLNTQYRVPQLQQIEAKITWQGISVPRQKLMILQKSSFLNTERDIPLANRLR